MAQDGTGTDESVRTVLDRDQKHVDETHSFVKDATRVAFANVTRRIGIDIGHQCVPGSGGVRGLEFTLIEPVNRSVEKARVPATVLKWTATPVDLGFFHQTIDELIIVRVKAVLREFFAG